MVKGSVSVLPYEKFSLNNSSQDLTLAYLHIILDISSVLCRLTIDMDYWL